MSQARIKRIRLGTCNSYLISGTDGFILIDGGNRNKGNAFLNALRKLSVSPESIKLVAVTYVHFDHVGSLAFIKKVCNCEIAVHESEKDILSDGTVVIPPGINMIGGITSTLGRMLKDVLFHIEPVQADISVSDEISLMEYGVDGKIVHTPGHTDGSISILLDDGRAFVGDVLINPLPGAPFIAPPFAGDLRRLIRTWRMLDEMDVKLLYPAHGRPVEIDRLRKEIKRRA